MDTPQNEPMDEAALKRYWDWYYQDVSDQICGVGRYVRNTNETKEAQTA